MYVFIVVMNMAVLYVNFHTFWYFQFSKQTACVSLIMTITNHVYYFCLNNVIFNSFDGCVMAHTLVQYMRYGKAR